MDSLLKSISNTYTYLMVDLADPATVEFPLVGNIMQPVSILMVYLLFVKIIGPKFMENRKAYNLDKFMIGYNIFQIITNACLFFMSVPFIFNLTPTCYVERNDVITYSTYFYYLSKILDLLDTVIFILRKKINQITFLHVFHHTLMVFSCWMGAKYVPYGHSVYLGCLNVFIHTVMYSYYLLAIWNKHLKTSLWWKKHLTQLQLVQFSLIFMFYGLTLLNPDCAYPKFIATFVFTNNIIMIILFGNFYYKTYTKIKKSN